MIPWDEDFLHVAAIVLFGTNAPVLKWIKGEPMPPSFAEQAVAIIGEPGA